MSVKINPIETIENYIELLEQKISSSNKFIDNLEGMIYAYKVSKTVAPEKILEFDNYIKTTSETIMAEKEIKNEYELSLKRVKSFMSDINLENDILKFIQRENVINFINENPKI